MSIWPWKGGDSATSASSTETTSTTLPGFGTSSPIPPMDDTTTDTTIDITTNSTATTTLLTEDVTTSAIEQLTATTASSIPWEATWWPSDQALLLLNYIDKTAALPNYALTIAATTLVFRCALLPLFIHGQRTTSRMAHMQPELKVLKDELEKMGDKIDHAAQIKHVTQTKALFNKYDCNPMFAIVPPLASAPIFMSMFFALRNAPEIFPEVLSTGGMWWFVDLTQPDPYCIMPIFSALLFLGITEAGKEQMMASDPNRGRTMVNAFRALAIVMVPLTMSFESSVFVYWTTNNTFSFVQTMVLKQPSVRKYFDIWDPPKPVPGQPAAESIFDEFKKLTEKKKPKTEVVNAWAKDRVKAHNEIIEQQRLVKRKLMEKETGIKAKG
jgi:YidC/Oxa1 family membrane protein insertase